MEEAATCHMLDYHLESGVPQSKYGAQDPDLHSRGATRLETHDGAEMSSPNKNGGTANRPTGACQALPNATPVCSFFDGHAGRNETRADVAISPRFIATARGSTVEAS